MAIPFGLEWAPRIGDKITFGLEWALCIGAKIPIHFPWAPFVGDSQVDDGLGGLVLHGLLI